MNTLLVVGGLGIFSLIAEIAGFKKWLRIFAVAGLIVAGFLAVLEWDMGRSYFSEMVVFDNFALAFSALLCTITVFWFFTAGDYLNTGTHQTDKTALILFSVAGGVCMVSFNHLVMFFLGIEILSLSLYVLAGSNKENLFSTEAGFKYFLLGSFATGFLLFGTALIYGSTGTFYLNTIAEQLISGNSEIPGFFITGLLMLMAGLFFKISVVPFHFWAPDVYEGSPTRVTAFMITVVKIAAIAAFYRLFIPLLPMASQSVRIILQVVIVLTLLIANFSALSQLSVKRMLAYSGIGHAGYLMLAFLADANSGNLAFYYLAAYSVASLLAFAVLSLIEKRTGEPVTVDHFGGLFKNSPFLAVSMAAALLSLAGIPPFSGFFAKYMVFLNALEAGYFWMVILAVLTSLLGIYYYFRVLIAMFSRGPEAVQLNPGKGTRILLILFILIILIQGILPDFFLGLF